MSFPALRLTNAGKQLITKSLSGDCGIEFTKIGFGNGVAPANIPADLVNIVKSITINSITLGTGCATLTATLDNANLETGFWWREIGVYATDPDDGEILYSYANAGDYADYIPAFTNQNYFRTILNITVVVGDAQDVTAVIGEYIGYATTEQLNAHTGNTSNPHQVDAEQIGLGKVPNVATNDQQPTFEAASSVATINSGEKLSVIFGKVKTAISSLISHFNAVNPHGITAFLIGAAEYSHEHSASDITSGTLPIAKGGTGATSAYSAGMAVRDGIFAYGSYSWSDADANTLKVPGLYRLSGSATNKPTSNPCTIAVIRAGTALSETIHQIALDLVDNSLHNRVFDYLQSEWRPWETKSFALVATSGSYTDLTNKPSLSTVAASGSYTDLLNTPSLATVATSGSYTDLSNRPTIPAIPDDYIAEVGYGEGNYQRWTWRKWDSGIIEMWAYNLSVEFTIYDTANNKRWRDITDSQGAVTGYKWSEGFFNFPEPMYDKKYTLNISKAYDPEQATSNLSLYGAVMQSTTQGGVRVLAHPFTDTANLNTTRLNVHVTGRWKA